MLNTLIAHAKVALTWKIKKPGKVKKLRVAGGVWGMGGVKEVVGDISDPLLMGYAMLGFGRGLELGDWVGLNGWRVGIGGWLVLLGVGQVRLGWVGFPVK